MFGADRGDMGVMMLHREQRNLLLFGIRLRELRAVKIRMQVVRNDRGLNGILPAHALHGVIEPAARLRRGQITDERGNERAVALRQANGIF